MLIRFHGFQRCNHLRVSLEQSVFRGTISRPRKIPHGSNLSWLLINKLCPQGFVLKHGGGMLREILFLKEIRLGIFLGMQESHH